ncbi:MAG TPA: L-threonylcarbamoyladenylate synthase [Chitinophagaceae bacterium]|nr:L-threonylcarbamoyladenylate synthase [Chitinophagaceae bacterium]
MAFEQDLEQCLAVLRAGGTILYPTDTIWGIGCDACNASAVEKIYEIKRRPKQKAMIVLLADPKEILTYVADPDPAVFDYLETVQKPTTVIYDNAIGLAENLVADDGSVAIRIVKDKFCRDLIHRLKSPLVSTSANLSGEPAPAHFAEIAEEIQKAVDYVVQYRRFEATRHHSSAVVKWNRNGSLTVIRP